MRRGCGTGAESGGRNWSDVIYVGDADAAGAGVALEAFEVGAHVGGVLVAEVAIFFEGFVDDAFELGREIGIEARDGDRAGD